MLGKAAQLAADPLGNLQQIMTGLQQTPADQFGAFAGVVQSLSGVLGGQLAPALSGVGNFISNLIGNAPLLSIVTSGIEMMTAAWELFADGTKMAALWQGVLEAVSMWHIVLIAALIGIITYLLFKFDGWGKSIKALWSIIKSFIIIVGVSYKEFFQELIFGFEWLWLKAKATFEFIGAFITNTIKALKLALHGDFSGAKAVLSAKITTEADGELEKAKKERASQQADNIKTVSDNVRNIVTQSKNISLTEKKNASNPVSDAVAKITKQGKGAPTAAAGVTNHPAHAVAKKAAVGHKKAAAAVKNTPADIASAGSATKSAITSGGARGVTINVAKFQDKTEIHTVNFKESVKEVEEIIRDMFLRVTHSASAARS